VQALFGPEGVSAVDRTVADAALHTVRELCAEMPTVLQYIENRILSLLDENRAAKKLNWTNNNAESINHVLKQATGWNRQRLPELINTLEALVNGQEKEEMRALFGVGDFQLASTYTHYAVPRERWLTMSKQQRDRSTRQFLMNTLNVGRRSHVTSTDGKLRVRQPTGSRKPHQIKRPKSNRTTTPRKTTPRKRQKGKNVAG